MGIGPPPKYWFSSWFPFQTTQTRGTRKSLFFPLKKPPRQKRVPSLKKGTLFGIRMFGPKGKPNFFEDSRIFCLLKRIFCTSPVWFQRKSVTTGHMLFFPSFKQMEVIEAHARMCQYSTPNKCGCSKDKPITAMIQGGLQPFVLKLLPYQGL